MASLCIPVYAVGLCGRERVVRWQSDGYEEIMNCPICHQPMKHDIDKLEFVVMSESYICANCHYAFEYDTGSYRITIGEREWGWTYQTSWIETKAIDFEVEVAVQKERSKHERESL